MSIVRMRIQGKLQQADLDEVLKFNLGKMYKAGFLFEFPSLQIWFGCIFCAIMGLFHQDWLMISVAAIIAVISCVIFWLLDTPRKKEKDLRKFNKIVADWIMIDSNGINLEFEDGKKTIRPWSDYKNFQECERILYLLGPRYGTHTVLPMADLSSVDKSALKELVSNSLPCHETS
jgi:hypothetical protein